MDQVHSLHVGRYMYWSEVLCCTITAHLRDLEVKVMSHLLTKHKSGELRCPATALISLRDFPKPFPREGGGLMVECPTESRGPMFVP